MNRSDLKRRIKRLGITPDNELITAYYIDRLESLRTQLVLIPNEITIVPNPESRNIIEKVFQDKNLSEILDSYVSFFDFIIQGALNDMLKNSHYTRFKELIINDIVQDDYLDVFKRKYKFIDRILTNVVENGINNIKRVIKRVLLDFGQIKAVFDNSISKLYGISFSGSDLHKGGQQVLFLEFRTHSGERKELIYKPSDLEVDCLISGDSVALEKAKITFFKGTKSLFELLNDQILKSNPNQLSPPYLFPVYKVLPKKYGTTLSGINELRESYGYIEYLSHDKASKSKFSFMRRRSDYLDFNIKNKADINEIASKFYSIIGQFSPFATILSMADVHQGNILVHDFKPYLIDMEVSLSRKIDIDNFTTPLIFSHGVLKHEEINRKLRIAEGNKEEIELDLSVRSATKNRLKYGSELINPQNYTDQIATGIENSLDLINSLKNSVFQKWIMRVSTCTVRAVPYPTRAYNDLRYDILNNINTIEQDNINYPNPLANLLSGRVQLDISNDWGLDVPKQDAIYGVKFLAKHFEYIKNDLANGDIPAFYHQLGTQQLVNSNGTPLAFPTTVFSYVDAAGGSHTLDMRMATINLILGNDRERNTADEFYKEIPFEDVRSKIQLVNEADTIKLIRIRKRMIQEMKKIVNPVRTIATP